MATAAPPGVGVQPGNRRPQRCDALNVMSGSWCLSVPAVRMVTVS